MVVVKFQYGNDVRRITLPSEGITYEQLLSLIESLYGQARPGDHPGLPQDFKLKYADEENDFIGLSCDNELRDALSLLPEGKVLRIMIVDVAPAPNSGPPATGTTMDDVVHNVLCHHCGHQVQGVLFLCVNCATDYCLCSECERQRPHDSQHLFLKIYAPLPPDALAQGVLPLLPNLYAPSASTSSAGTQQACPNWIRQRKASDGASRGRAACYNKRTGPRREDQKLACRFVEDITVDDGHAMTPGSPFVKIWRLRNSGNVAWPEGVALSFVSGDSLSLFESIPVMSVAPGAEVDVSVDMTAPKEVGRYVSNWRLQSPSGVFFGHQVWADIMVVKELDAGKSADSENDKPAVQNRESDDSEEEDSDTNESEWELGRSKVRRIAKVIRGRSHSDIDSDDEALSEADAEAEERGEQEETIDQTRDEGDNVAPAAQEAQEVAEEKKEEEEAQHQPPQQQQQQQQSPASSEDEEWEVVPAKEEWADELAALRALGLDDLDAIRRALKEAKGNVDLAAQSLLGD